MSALPTARSADVDPHEAIATLVINAINVRGYTEVGLFAGGEVPLRLTLFELAYWLRDALTELDAVMVLVTE